MKRYLTFFILMFCECCYSQTYGLRIGMNKTLMAGYSGHIAYRAGPIYDIVETDKNHLYFNGGLVAEFPLNKQKNRFSIESGLILKTIGKDGSVTYTSIM